MSSVKATAEWPRYTTGATLLNLVPSPRSMLQTVMDHTRCPRHSLGANDTKRKK